MDETLLQFLENPVELAARHGDSQVVQVRNLANTAVDLLLGE